MRFDTIMSFIKLLLLLLLVTVVLMLCLYKPIIVRPISLKKKQIRLNASIYSYKINTNSLK